MTKRQVITTLKTAGLLSEQIEVRGSGQNWEVEIAPTPETENSTPYLNTPLMEKIQEALGVPTRSYTTGYHAWIMQPGEFREADLLDYCNKASSAHY